MLQLPLSIVHLNTYVPYNETVAVAPGVLAVGANVTVPGPDIFVHVPAPADAELPASVATRVLQSVWSGPALAASA